MSLAFKKTPFDLNTFFDAELDEHQTIAARTKEALREHFIKLVEAAETTLLAGGKLVFMGNGGSAADAQHLATEFTVRYRLNRRPMAALALTTDTSTLTAIGNDFGFDFLFSRQVEALVRTEDLIIAITTSGKSPNIINALKKAREMGVKTVGLTGNTGGELPGLADLLLIIPSTTTSRIQEMHIMLGQMLCGALEYRLGLIEG
jgi:D-sedoheptulose 7-phosphate isomerase